MDIESFSATMLSAVLCVGIAMLFFGGDALAKGAVSLALKLKIDRLIVGMTVVSIATSMPEMLVSVNGAMTGYADIAVGNIVGSNMANIGLVLALSAIICPMYVNRGMLKAEIPALIISTLIFCAMCISGPREISRHEGFLLLFLTGAYMAYFIVQASMQRKRRISADTPKPDLQTPDEQGVSESMSECSIPATIAYLIGGGALLYFGAQLVLVSSAQIARSAGLSEAFIGLSIVAVGTSLPELAASLVAAIKKQSDIAIGNVVGSNIMNILLIGGATAAISPVKVSESFTGFDIPAMCFITFLLAAIFYCGLRLGRRKGAILLVTYICAILYSASKSAII